MNIEERTLFVAAPGGASEKLVLAIEAERVAAQKARIKYLKSKGPDVVNLWGSDNGIVALILKEGAKMLAGWRRDSKLHRKHCAPDGGVFAVPDGKNKATYAAAKEELRSLPRLPDLWSFTSRIGYAPQLIGHRMLLCTYERVDGKIVIFIPKRGESDGGAKRPPFVPADCEPLKWSQYCAMKEELAEAKK